MVIAQSGRETKSATIGKFLDQGPQSRCPSTSTTRSRDYRSGHRSRAGETDCERALLVYSARGIYGLVEMESQACFAIVFELSLFLKLVQSPPCLGADS